MISLLLTSLKTMRILPTMSNATHIVIPLNVFARRTILNLVGMESLGSYMNLLLCTSMFLVEKLIALLEMMIGLTTTTSTCLLFGGPTFTASLSTHAMLF